MQLEDLKEFRNLKEGEDLVGTTLALTFKGEIEKAILIVISGINSKDIFKMLCRVIP